MSEEDFKNLYDSIRLNLFQDMSNRLEELKINYVSKESINEERRKIIELVERLDKYEMKNKTLPMLQVLRELFRVTKKDLPFEKFFRYDDSIFDKNGKFSNDILNKCFHLYCEFIGVNRSLYRDAEYKFLIMCIKDLEA